MNGQCTYLGYVLLEAPCEYVLHGPFLSFNWLRLCPHLGGPRPKPRCPDEVVYSPNDSCSHFTQRLFPPKVPQQHTWIISYSSSNIIHTYYTSHLYTQLHLLLYMSCSHIHFFGSSWQAGCPRLLVSYTITTFPFPLFLNQNMTGFNGSLFSAFLSPVKIFAP
jgi:hypothetical protein